MKWWTKAPSKTCQLDLISTWLLKQLSDTLSLVIASLFNWSFDAGVFELTLLADASDSDPHWPTGLVLRCTAITAVADGVQSVTTSGRRHLRSETVKRTTRTKFGECVISYSGPAAWKGLPSPHLRTITDTCTFKRHLKSFLFTDSFS